MRTMHPIVMPALLATLMPVLAQAGQPIDERRNLAADGTVSVVNVAGDITVTTWDRNEVHLTGELGDESELDISGTDRGLRFEVKFRNGRNRGHNHDASTLNLVVPATASLAVSGVSSDIDIRDLRGATLTAETVSGDVEVVASVGRAELKSVSGDVEFHGTCSRTTAETVSGDVELSGLDGELNVNVVSGDVELDGGSFDRVRFETVSGTLELSLAIRPGGSVNVESMSGDVRVALPADADAEIRARTFSGDIRSRFGSPQKPRYGSGSSLEHTAGSGGASLNLESFSGDVEISLK